MRQGDREIRANDVEYNADDTALKVNGELEYIDPVVHVTGSGGNYSASQGADFNAAEFELRERSARGAAEAHAASRPTASSQLDEREVHHLPAER